jgi:SAM-dependent MidA family methyltransferase
LLKYFPYEDLHIYELGAGNGTLAKDILDYLRSDYPEVYDRTKYITIEISGQLANRQKAKLAGHACARVENQSIFEWSAKQPAPCFVIALEVIVSPSSHNLLRLSEDSGQSCP